MSVKDIKNQWNDIDLVGNIKTVQDGSYLLQELGLFSRATSKTPSAKISDIVQAENTKLSQVNRFSTETNAVQPNTAVIRDASIPLYHATDSVTPQSWQGLLSPNTNSELAITEVMADKSLAFERAYRRTVEEALSETVFHQRATNTHSDDGDIDFNMVFGTTPGSFEFDGNAPIYQQLSKLRRQISVAVGGARNYMDKVVLLADSAFFDVLAGNDQLQAYVTNNVKEAKLSGAVIPNEIAGYNAMSIGNLTIVDLAGDPLYDIPEGQAIAVPRFTSPDFAFLRRVVGPASRSQTEALKGEVKDRYAYSTVDDLGMINLYSEFSMLPVLLRPQWLTNLTLTA